MTKSFLGKTDVVQNRKERLVGQMLGFFTFPLCLFILAVVAGLTAFSLFFISRSEYEFLWFALMQIFQAAHLWFNEVAPGLLPAFSLNRIEGIQEISSACVSISTVLFLSYVLRARRNWLAWAAISIFAVAPVLRLLSFYGLPSQHFEIASATSRSLLLLAWTLWTLGRGLRQRLPDAHVLLIPILLNAVCEVGVRLSNSFRILALPVPWFVRPFEAGLPLPLWVLPSNVADFLFLLSVLAILVRRFTRTRRAEERYARELEEARMVQQVLVPEETPAVPGFSIASVYQPAQQVGGDFFQIIPLTYGVLVAVGDVSGKGLPAAMTVSLIVGTLRTLAEQTESPAEILRGLNRRLLGRSGFTTCLIASLRQDGSGVLANAGHLRPYRNGAEIETVSDVPLGLSLDANYQECAVALCPNDFVTFLSDGVVEAKNAKGELFGFDRTRQNSTQPADAIAKTAMQFGQQDDITVLTVKYCPVALPG